MSSGTDKAWEMLSGLNPGEVCGNASVSLDDKTSSYIIRSLGTDFSVSPEKRELKSQSQGGDYLINRFGYFFNHSVLWYLIGAKDIPASGRLIKPQSVKGGHHFFMGTHQLPLENLSEKYRDDRDGFIKKGLELGGRALDYGDASVELFPMPRVPVTLILWLSDKEFQARADLLFDSTCELHLPLDIIWSIAMMSVLAMF
ncbi:MAG: DUF3786 domain-containing protein [Thermodesulfovibrionales bacterium]|nr:DUF3786 domain-containing protein [Thermodesulfovibrionales bacterium]